MIDIHTHILNNVDDGSKSLETSIKIIKSLSEKGVKDIFLTPHYIIDTQFELDYNEKEEKFNILKEELKRENIDVNIYLGNEIYINPKIKENILKDNICMNNTKYLLIEFPLNGEYNNIYGILSGLIEKGYKVILAHPERYLSVQKDISILDEYKSMGVLFQANIGSIFGMYGKSAKKTIKKLIKSRYIDFLGTDVHSNHFDYKYFDKLDKKIIKLSDIDYLNNIKYNNAKEKLL